jgi:hypothetical protein
VSVNRHFDRLTPEYPDLESEDIRALLAYAVLYFESWLASFPISHYSSRANFFLTVSRCSGGTNHSTNPHPPQMRMRNFGLEKKPNGSSVRPSPTLALTSREYRSLLPQFLHGVKLSGCAGGEPSIPVPQLQHLSKLSSHSALHFGHFHISINWSAKPEIHLENRVNFSKRAKECNPLS